MRKTKPANWAARKLRPAWEYRSRSELWSIYPTGHQLILGEERDSEKKKAGFFCIHRLTGKIIWSKELPSGWWVGVEAVTEDMVFLHGFASPDMPLHKGITAMDVVTGETRWEQPELCFEGFAGKNIVGSRGAYGNKSYASVEIASGNVLEEWSDPDSRFISHGMNLPGTICFPETTIGGAGGPEVVRQFLDQQQATGPASWLSAGGIVVVASKLSSDQTIDVIRSADGEVIFSDFIATGQAAFVPDAFLLQESMLYLVRDKRDLVAVDLREEITDASLKGN